MVIRAMSSHVYDELPPLNNKKSFLSHAHFIVKGQETPLCVTHLYSIFNTSGDYFAETFVAQHEVFLVNLRACGNSVDVTEPYSLSLLETVFDLEAIREALGFKQWGYAGHSTGGILGVVYGIYASMSLTHAVIVGAAARDYMTLSPSCIYNEAHPLFARMQQLFARLQQQDLPEAMRKQYGKERTQLSLYVQQRYDDYFCRPITKHMSSARLHYFNREIQLFDVTRKLHLMTTRTLIIAGQHDVQCPVEHSVEMAQLMPNATFVLFTESNHYPFLEQRSFFDDTYSSFLQSQ